MSLHFAVAEMTSKSHFMSSAMIDFEKSQYTMSYSAVAVTIYVHILFRFRESDIGQKSCFFSTPPVFNNSAEDGPVLE